MSESAAAGLADIHPVPRDRIAGAHRSFSRRTYFQSIFVLRHLLDGVGASCCLDLREAKQITQSIVEHILEDEDAALALDLVGDWERDLFAHSVNVAVLSVALGRRMGLGRTLLGDLGVAALFHDIGSIGRRGAPAGTASFRRLVMQGGCSDMMLRAALLVHEHHSTGGEAAAASLLARILGVADRFERLVRDLAPRGALAILSREVPSGRDPGILAVLEAVIEEDALVHE